MGERLHRPKGTQDILPPLSRAWEAAVATFRTLANRYGYDWVITPTFESADVFARTAGAGSELVSKQMYTFTDRGDRLVALRPEGTASVVRAFLEAGLHGQPLPWKTYYVGPMFRYERPQAGRYREFWQVGVECLGASSADVDVEVIALGAVFYRALGITALRVDVNSLGDFEDRTRHRDALVAYLTGREAELSAESRATLTANPLRVFDSKRPEDQAVLAAAPTPDAFLGPAAKSHYARVQEGLAAQGIDFVHRPGLVRGLDYYKRTVFEYVDTATSAAQDALGGGGRYDGLVADLGGPDIGGVGFALGLERTIAAIGEGGPRLAGPTAFVIGVGVEAEDEVRDLLAELRAAGVSADSTYDQRSVSSALSFADRRGARYALLVGSDELAAGVVAVRDLASREQVDVRRQEVVAWLSAR